MKVKLKEIEFDKDIYPRKHVSHEAVRAYCEALKGGTVFPPIEVQRIDYGNGVVKLVCLDGKHRIQAIEEYNKWLSRQRKEGNEEVKGKQPIREVEVVFWKDEVIKKEEYLEDLRLRSLALNLKHGERIKASDLGDVVLKIIKDRPIERLNGVVTDIARKLGFAPSTISELQTSEGKVSDILRKRRYPRDLTIWRLVRLGWTHSAAGKLFGLTRQRAEQIASNFDSEKSSIQHQFFQKKKTIKEICEFSEMDELTAWTMILDGKEDIERFKILGVKPKAYDVWNFSDCHPLMGIEYPGRIPGQLIMNLLYYYTKQGDLVADFMAGGGTTADACLLMNRMCFCSDANPQREFIIKHKLDKSAKLPDMSNMKIKKPNLIFTDPPYWSMKSEEYGNDSISNLPLEEYYEFIENYAKECYNLLKSGGIFAFLIQNQTGRDLPEGEEAILHTLNCSIIFKEVGFKPKRIISCPQGTQQDQPQEVERAVKERRMLGQVRDLLIFEKP